jgi:hypothetical protein
MFIKMEQGIKSTPLFEIDGASVGGGENSNATPAESTVSNDQGNQAQSNQSQSQSNSESFAKYSKIDLNTVPEPLRPILQEKISNIDKTFTQTMQEIAPLRKLAEETGMSVDQIREQLNYVASINKDPKSAVKGYLSQDQAVLLELLKENPMQAAQLFGQVFNGQQPQQTSPYGDVADYDEFGGRVEKRAAESTLNQVKQQYDPRLTAVEKFVKQQYENGVKAQLNPKIPEALRDKVWGEVSKIGIPMTIVESQPWVIDGLIIQASGGKEEYDKLIKTQTQTKRVEQVIDNHNNTVNHIPNGGVAAIQTNANMSWNERKKLAARQVAGMNSTS